MDFKGTSIFGALGEFALIEIDGTEHVLREPHVTIGRTSDCTVQIMVATVSRLHAHLTNELGSWYLSDDQSRNGTFLNGKQIEVGSRKEVHDGDIIGLGNDAQLTFQKGSN